MADYKKHGGAQGDLVKEAREAFQRCAAAESDNRKQAESDIKFGRLGEQWPADILAQREKERRPCLTINKMTAFIRQVVNDARQNKPSIKVRPADSGADVETAEIINGLIRNIEYTSNADVAYDTSVECAVSGGFGYIRVGLDYAFDDTFDMDITINRVANPFSVYGDPNSTAADSSDWDVAFVVDRMARSAFEAKYGDRASTDWDDDAAWAEAGPDWRDDETVMVAEWWTREEVERDIVQLEDGRILDKAELDDPEMATALQMDLISIKAERTTRSHKVTQRIISGVDVLEENEWPGKYIPIIPVYGDEFDIKGKRYLRSLIHSAKDAARMFNYWRTTGTELVALAPRVPFIGPEGAFDVDDRWLTANTESHPYLEYDKSAIAMPQRQPLDMGVAAGALQEALNASDDMKAIIGLYDASLGARSNETSGKAIQARQREGDVATFHFIDNMARAIRHTGRIIIDLIPKVYDQPRVLRVLGEDGSQEEKRVNQPTPKIDEKTGEPVMDDAGEPVMALYDLTAGKYDLTVTTGPSFSTRREEAAAQMTEMIRAYPQAAPLMADILARNFDWPGADEIADRFEAAMPKPQDELPPELQQMIEAAQQHIGQLQEENQTLKLGEQVKTEELRIKEFEAITQRMQVMGRAQIDQTQTTIKGFEAAMKSRALDADPNPQY